MCLLRIGSSAILNENHIVIARKRISEHRFNADVGSYPSHDDAAPVFCAKQIFDVRTDKGTVAVLDDNRLASGGSDAVKLCAPSSGDTGVGARCRVTIDPRP